MENNVQLLRNAQCAIKEPGEIKGPSSQSLCLPAW